MLPAAPRQRIIRDPCLALPPRLFISTSRFGVLAPHLARPVNCRRAYRDRSRRMPLPLPADGDDNSTAIFTSGDRVKALSIRQSWASLIANGIKTIETRTWPTLYRGKLLICAARTRAAFGEPSDLPTGVAVAIVRLVDVRPMHPRDATGAAVPFSRALYAWVLEDPRPIEPFPVKGQLRLFEVNERKLRDA